VVSLLCGADVKLTNLSLVLTDHEIGEGLVFNPMPREPGYIGVHIHKTRIRIVLLQCNTG